VETKQRTRRHPDEERLRAKAWCDTAAFHARNEGYWHDRATSEKTPLRDRVRAVLFIAASDAIRAALFVRDTARRARLWAKSKRWT
jgi:hypothetical protein